MTFDCEIVLNFRNTYTFHWILSPEKRKRKSHLNLKPFSAKIYDKSNYSFFYYHKTAEIDRIWNLVLWVC